MIYLSHLSALKAIRELRVVDGYGSSVSNRNFDENRISFQNSKARMADVDLEHLPGVHFDTSVPYSNVLKESPQNTSYSIEDDIYTNIAKLNRSSFTKDVFGMKSSKDSCSIDYDRNNKHHNRVDVLLESQNQKIKSGVYKYHVCNASLTRTSFIKINKNIAISSPELTFIQLAEVLDFSVLMMAGMELCGKYVICCDDAYSFDASMKGFVNIANGATTVEKISHYINVLSKRKESKYLRGIKKARNAVRYLSNNSASPKESQIYIMLSGPRKYGMYGINDLHLNYMVKFGHEGIKVAGQDKAFIDIAHPYKKIAIEYDSRMYHDEKDKSQSDKRRADALLCEGWTVFHIVPEQINDAEAFDVLATRILSYVTSTKKIENKKFYENNMSQFKKMFSMNLKFY